MGGHIQIRARAVNKCSARLLGRSNESSALTHSDGQVRDGYVGA